MAGRKAGGQEGTNVVGGGRMREGGRKTIFTAMQKKKEGQDSEPFRFFLLGCRRRKHMPNWHVLLLIPCVCPNTVHLLVKGGVDNEGGSLLEKMSLCA